MTTTYHKAYNKRDCETFAKTCRDISQEQKAINGGKKILTEIYNRLSKLPKNSPERGLILKELFAWEFDQRNMKLCNRLRQRGLSILSGQHSPQVGEKFIYG